jgi:hypothetical protein
MTDSRPDGDQEDQADEVTAYVDRLEKSHGRPFTPAVRQLLTDQAAEEAAETAVKGPPATLREVGERVNGRIAARAARDRAAAFEWAARQFEPTAKPGDDEPRS